MMEAISCIARAIERLVGYVFAYLTGYSQAERDQEDANEEAKRNAEEARDRVDSMSPDERRDRLRDYSSK